MANFEAIRISVSGVPDMNYWRLACKDPILLQKFIVVDKIHEYDSIQYIYGPNIRLSGFLLALFDVAECGACILVHDLMLFGQVRVEAHSLGGRGVGRANDAAESGVLN